MFSAYYFPTFAITMERIRSLFERYSGVREYRITPLPASGGNRQYFRINWDGGSCIAAAGTSLRENGAFLYLDRHFSRLGLPVPEVLAVSGDRMAYLQEDLGDTTLFDAVAAGRRSGEYSPEEKTLLRLNYFKYCFLKPSGVEFDEVALEEDLVRLRDRLLVCSSENFQYRDFQGRNIMLTPSGEMKFIDFQGGRMGPVHYDLASFVWQARARYSPELKAELTEAYLEAQSHYEAVCRKDFLTDLRQFVLFRTLQVLGAYGFRGMFERRPHFLESIPYAMDNLQELFSSGTFPEYPCLCRALEELIPLYGHRAPRQDGKLLIRIFSFSYKKGIPEDEGGNGGGYVLDCRGVPNPGRLPEYRAMTGLDGPVIEYLQGYSETEEFARHTAALADMHIENYLERGFTDLMFCFGCTGGRHRSVYFAERLADHLAERYGDSSDRLSITLVHREQNLERQVL